MSVRKAAVLVDTNVLIEAHATGCWRALCGHYAIETVLKCSEEAQTGRIRLDRKVVIPDRELRETLRWIEPITEPETISVDLLDGEGLHAGEKHLWTYALRRPGDWVLCGPDKASLRFGYDQGLRQRLVSLEELLKPINVKARPSVRRHFTRSWHIDTMTEFAQAATGSP